MQNYKNLEVWKIAKEVAVESLRLTMDEPLKSERAISDQIKRSSLSVVSNIAEGAGRDTNKEKMRFLDMACGSLYELESQLLVVASVWPQNSFMIENVILKNTESIGKMLRKFKETLSKVQ